AAPTLGAPPPGGRGRENPRDTRSATPAGRPGGSQQPLHHDDVNPLAVQLTLLAIHAHLDETQAAVERDTGRIEWNRRDHELVVVELAGPRDQRLQQAVTHAPPAPFAPDVHREVRDVVIRGARVERVQAAPADDPAVDLRDDDRMA